MHTCDRTMSYWSWKQLSLTEISLRLARSFFLALPPPCSWYPPSKVRSSNFNLDICCYVFRSLALSSGELLGSLNEKENGYTSIRPFAAAVGSPEKTKSSEDFLGRRSPRRLALSRLDVNSPIKSRVDISSPIKVERLGLDSERRYRYVNYLDFVFRRASLSLLSPCRLPYLRHAFLV